MSRHDSKDAILDAAQAIVIESGALQMTLDAVAKRSGISKGGLLYNFPSKEALLEAMIVRMMESWDRLREEVRKELPKESSNELMVEIRVFQKEAESDGSLSAGLLAVIANNPDLTSKIRGAMRDRFNTRIASAGSFARSSVLFFAAMGLHFHDLLNLSILNKKQRDEIQKELFRLSCCDRDI